MSRALSREEIFKRICVRDPYFALTDLSLDAGEMTAVVEPEQPLGLEGGPIAAAEAGRHLAILGSCAAAFSRADEDRHFYLATTATLTRRAASPAAFTSTRLLARARGWCQGRDAGARGTLMTVDGAPVFDLDVGYRVVPQRLFERLFKHAHCELRQAPRASHMKGGPLNRTNPYRAALALEFDEVTDQQGKARLASVTPAQCAGHFAQYPTMPVAILMSGLVAVASSILSQRMGGDAPFVVTRADVRAEQLIAAGQPLLFEGRHLSDNEAGQDFRCRATDDRRETAGELALSVRRL